MAKSKCYRGTERRKHRRFEYPLYVSYKKNGKKFQEELLKSSTELHLTVKEKELSISRNISVAGICFVTKEKFSSNTRLLVKIWSPAGPRPLIGLAEVMWHKKRSPGSGYLTGVAFASLDDKNELSKLLDIFKELKVKRMVGE